jgi:hypothetical protein
MKTIIKNDNFTINKDEIDNHIFTISFNSYSEALIKSITKTKIILGATTTEKYNTLTFKSENVQTFNDFQMEMKRETGTTKIQYELLLKMTQNLANQLNYLISNYSKTFLGYSPENLIVIDKHKFVYLSSEYLLNINDENVIITFPFSQNDFFMSPELLNVIEIPSFINYKVAYFSFGCLLLYGLIGDDDFLKNDDEKTSRDKLKCIMDTIFIKNTPLYWLLKRCLVEEPKNRSIIFI